jgi:NADH:ubiquinone oxidoreductase subunit E
MVFGNEFPMKVQVCKGRSCTEKGAQYVERRLMADVNRLWSNIPDIQIESCLCQGKCQQAPNVLFEGVLISRANPVVASEQLTNRLKQYISSKSAK